MSAPKKRRTKFTVTIYCGNCRTVGDYEFTRGTILHAHERYAMAERTNGVPNGEREHTIRLNDRWHGPHVECRFCRCSNALYTRERKESPNAE